MEEKRTQRDLLAQAPNRRRFVQRLGVASALAAAALENRGLAQSTTIQDSDILNFALNLEYLEAEFYTAATTGGTIAQQGVTVSGAGSSGPTSGGAQVTFTDPTVKALAMELAFDERTHVALLQKALAGAGAQAIAKPAINLNALGIGFGSQTEFLTLARAFEDIGVTAYGGAAPLIQDKSILGYAARILAAEASHSGAIRLQVETQNIPTMALDGADHLPGPSGNQFFNLDSNALSEVRTPGQVLYIAFGGKANANSGGFFPNGVNGILNTSSATAATSDGNVITASPNPIDSKGTGFGATTIAWSAPGAQIVQVRVGAPDGALFTDNFPTGSMMTGDWVTNGMTFYLQDVTNGKALAAANTLATLTVTVD
jgi:hypothetical protein